MWGPLVIASTLAHVGCPLTPELAGPLSALAPQRLRPTTPGRFSAMFVWFGVLTPPPGWGGIWVYRLAEPGDWSDEWTTVSVAPELRVRYWVGIYTEELGRALRAVTRDESETEPVSAAREQGDADEREGGDVSSVECDSSSDVDDELVTAM